MSGAALYLGFIIPVLAIVGFGGWIGATRWADHHPRHHGDVADLRNEVSGGSFTGGGRQLMPRRDATPPEAEKYEQERRASQ